MLELRGRVVRGEQLGRTIGYPTANLTKNYFHFHPISNGVYAGWAYCGQEQMPAVAIIGVDKKIEVHLIGFRGDLYGKQLRFVVVKKLRGIKKFSGGKKLVEQIKQDIKQATQALKKL